MDRQASSGVELIETTTKEKLEKNVKKPDNPEGRI